MNAQRRSNHKLVANFSNSYSLPSIRLVPRPCIARQLSSGSAGQQRGPGRRCSALSYHLTYFTFSSHL